MPDYTILVTATVEREFVVTAPNEDMALAAAKTETVWPPDVLANVSWYVYDAGDVLRLVRR